MGHDLKVSCADTARRIRLAKYLHVSTTHPTSAITWAEFQSKSKLAL